LSFARERDGLRSADRELQVDSLSGRWELPSESTKEEAVMAGSHNDAMLMVELAKWGSMIGLADASKAIFADDFDPDAVEIFDTSIQPLLVFHETIGTLVKNGLFDRDLVYDWLWVAGSWERVAPAVRRAREQAGVAALYENYEALAAGQTP
jgi:hypothetical protein